MQSLACLCVGRITSLSNKNMNDENLTNLLISVGRVLDILAYPSS